MDSIDKIDNLMLGGSGADAHVIDRESYVDVNKVNKYDFMEYSYFGTSGYRDGTFLIPHEREMMYENRKALTFYKNFVQPICNATYQPIFAEEIERIVKDDAGNETDEYMINDFIVDCDNNKTSLQHFMEEVGRYASMHGVVFVVVENFPSQELPILLADAKEQRKFPYVYTRTAQDVFRYRVNKFGQIESITFCEEPFIQKDDKGNEYEFKQYREWTKGMTTLYREDKNGKLQSVEITLLGIDVLPVVSVYFTKKQCRKDILVEPPLYDIAKVNLAIFNKDSEIRSQERSQGFSVFYVQSNASGNLSIGDKNVLYIPLDSTMAPGYASPNPAILTGLVENNKIMRDDLFRMAEQKGVTIVQAAASGVSQQWDFRGQEATLKRNSTTLSTAEYAIVDLFQQYCPQEQFTYTCGYPMDFAPNSTTEELTNLIKGLADITLPPKSQALLQAKIVRLLTSDQDPDAVADAVEEINQLVIDKAESDLTTTTTEGADAWSEDMGGDSSLPPQSR